MGNPARSFRDMRVWQSAEDVCVLVYGITKKFPEAEKFGLSSQIRRASVSVPSNIAEGFGRRSSKEKAQFYHHSLGSLFEVEAQLSIATRLDYVSADDVGETLDEIERCKALLLKLIETNGLKIR
jgi:four helix bundle protein